MNNLENQNINENLKAAINSFDNYRVKQFEKIFSNLRSPVSLLNSLAAHSKDDLDNIRKNLDFSGMSALNKQQLIIALEENIKRSLPIVLKQLTEKEHKFLKKLIKNHGSLKFDKKFSEILPRFRNIGLIGCYTNEVNERFIFLPEDIIHIIDTLLKDKHILNTIKENERFLRLVNRLLFFYGALLSFSLMEIVKLYLDTPLSSAEMFTLLFNAPNLRYIDGYWCSKDTLNDFNLIEEQKSRNAVEYHLLTKEELFSTDLFNFNMHDFTLIDYICKNFAISKDDCISWLSDIKLEFKIGTPHDVVIKEFMSCFKFYNLAQSNKVLDLVTHMYNNAPQWFLKGNSPLDLSHQNQSSLLPLQSLSVKTGRNKPCVCGSGKKFKNCCYK